MERVFSRVAEINAGVEEIERTLLDLKKVKNILNEKNVINEDVMNQRGNYIKDLDTDKATLVSNKLNLEYQLKRVNYNREKHEIQYNLDGPGIKTGSGNLWIQCIPDEERKTRMRLVVEYGTTLSCAGLILKTVKKEKIEEGLNNEVLPFIENFFKED